MVGRGRTSLRGGSTGMAEIAVLLPALNEGRGIGSVLDRIPVDELRERGHDVKIWVLDGRSTDKTVEVARSRGARVFLQDGKGKGRAVSQALGFVQSDYIVMLDADNTYDPRDMLPMLPMLEDGHDVVMGSRVLGTMCDGAMTSKNRIGNSFLSSTASMLFRRRVTDLCTGFWGFKGSALRKIVVDAKGFELEAQLFSRSVKSRLRVGEVPIAYGCRSGDETKLRGFSAGARIVWTLLSERLRRGTLNHRNNYAYVVSSAGNTETASAKFVPDIK